MGTAVMKYGDFQIDLNTINNVLQFELVYHQREDTLFIRPHVPKPAISMDWEGEVWIRFDPKSGEILGFEINDFEHHFLKSHTTLASAWKEIKPMISKQKADGNRENFLKKLLEFILSLINNCPQQEKIEILPALT
jgi:hypothetical protein